MILVGSFSWRATHKTGAVERHVDTARAVNKGGTSQSNVPNRPQSPSINLLNSAKIQELRGNTQIMPNINNRKS